MCTSDECTNDELDRRSFLAGVAASVTALALMQPESANSQTKPPETRVLDDPKVQHGRVTFKHNGNYTIDGYLARPRAEGAYPGVVVIAGNKISEEYIPNTCAALALAGFVGIAPNIFHPLPDDAAGSEYERYLTNHTELDRLDDVHLGVSYLRTQPFVRSGGIGALGFCRGGREAMLFGARSRDVDAVVAFHPAPMTKEQVVRLKKVPVLIHHGTADNSVSITNTFQTEKFLKAQGTPCKVFSYDAADHGFLAYTRPFYKPDMAKLAWERTIRFLHSHLK